MWKVLLISICLFVSCNSEQEYAISNPEIELNYPDYFPDLNQNFSQNPPTKYGVQLGDKLFNDKRLSVNNSISCSSCHLAEKAFADTTKKAKGVFDRVALRNALSLQNLAFKKFYMWDGNHHALESQVLVPIITKEEMGSTILQVIGKIENDISYQYLFEKTFGDSQVTGERIYKSIAQYEYTLISANSRYDSVLKGYKEFTDKEAKGYKVFQQKCISCHSTELFTDQSFRNVGFPVNPDKNEKGRARVTFNPSDYLSFRVPSLRNIEYTAPYGSFGQFNTIKEVLDYFDKGVLDAENLDPILKNNNGRIPLTEIEKEELIQFLKTLSDKSFVNRIKMVKD